VLTKGRDGTARLWDSLSGKQRAILGEAWPKQIAIAWENQAWEKWLQFSSDGRTALTIHPTQAPKISLDAPEWTVRLWDVDTGRLRAETARHPGLLLWVQLSQDHSVLVTLASTVTSASGADSRASPGTTAFAWNAENGQLIRKVQINISPTWCAVSPDGTSVLLPDWHSSGEWGMQVWFPQRDSPPRVLPEIKGQCSTAFFSPSGKSAVIVAEEAVSWWDTRDWKLHQKWKPLKGTDSAVFKDLPAFGHENIVMLVPVDGQGGFMSSSPAPQVFIRGLPEPITSANQSECRASPDGTLVAFAADEVYDSRTGERRPLPRGRRIDPELRHFTDDGRFALFPNSFLADLATDTKIGGNVASRFLKNQNAWIGIDPGNAIFFLRKADAALDAGLLEKWCQVITRGELDERGRFRKLKETNWDKRRQELAILLETNTDAQSLRAAATDRLYWLRQEIKDSSDPLPLLDRLITAEPTWPNYSRRAEANFAKERWAEAARDELEAAKLTDGPYWLEGSSFKSVIATGMYAGAYGDWRLGANIFQTLGRPPEHYELALRWGEARSRAGVGETGGARFGGGQSNTKIWVNGRRVADVHVGRTSMIALAHFRLGRYADALAILQKRDVPMISMVAGMLMSPWNLLTIYEPAPVGLPGGGFAVVGVPAGWVQNDVFTIDPVDVIVRAMCYHHLNQPQEAAACLHLGRDFWGKDEGTPEQRALLQEAEALIEEKDHR